ncbi:hypothetical protein D3C84_606280 [compost metagenome]
MALQFGELDAVVGALHFHGVMGLLGGHHQAVGHGHGDDVGEVVLALGVVVGQAPQPVGQALARHGENAGIAFADGALLGGRVLVFDDGLHHARRVANNAAVAGRVDQVHGEQGELVVLHLLQQALQGLHFDQRYVAIEDQYALGTEMRQRLGDGVAGAQLFGLQHKAEVIRGQPLAYRLGAMTYDDVDALGGELAGGVNDVAEHGLAGHRMQHLGQGRTHASALAGGEDDDIEGHGRNHQIRL